MFPLERLAATIRRVVGPEPPDPAAPAVPAEPAPPALPPAPDAPPLPADPAPPDIPPVPACPALPDVPPVPACPALPDVPPVPDCPALPDVPPVPACPALPDVPPVPACPALPDVPPTLPPSSREPAPSPSLAQEANRKGINKRQERKLCIGNQHCRISTLRQAREAPPYRREILATPIDAVLTVRPSSANSHLEATGCKLSQQAPERPPTRYS